MTPRPSRSQESISGSTIPGRRVDVDPLEPQRAPRPVSISRRVRRACAYWGCCEERSCRRADCKRSRTCREGARPRSRDDDAGSASAHHYYAACASLRKMLRLVLSSGLRPREGLHEMLGRATGAWFGREAIQLQLTFFVRGRPNGPRTCKRPAAPCSQTLILQLAADVQTSSARPHPSLGSWRAFTSRAPADGVARRRGRTGRGSDALQLEIASSNGSALDRPLARIASTRCAVRRAAPLTSLGAR